MDLLAGWAVDLVLLPREQGVVHVLGGVVFVVHGGGGQGPAYITGPTLCNIAIYGPQSLVNGIDGVSGGAGASLVAGAGVLLLSHLRGLGQVNYTYIPMVATYHIGLSQNTSL